MLADRFVRLCRIAIVTVTFIASVLNAAEIHWSWEDTFSSAEQQKLTAWVETVVTDVEDAVGPFPFDLHVRFHRTQAQVSPVPWANTIRSSRRQGVNIHVDPDFSRSELLADWTVYHELSHLSLPFLGRNNAWFAEGYASFMQYQLMHAAGEMTTDEMRAIYHSKIDAAARRYDMPETNFIDATPLLRARRDYPTQYWGGAVYFLRIDKELRANGSSVIDVVKEYVNCCRAPESGLDDLVDSLDRIAGPALFSRELEAFRQGRGFPDYSGLL